MSVPLKNVIVWTDNAPHQYRCRQNFMKVATVAERHEGITLTHRLAVVDNFKGYHDSVGKDPAHLVRTLELAGIRSPTAFKVFENCFKRLQKTEDDTEWKELEDSQDERLKSKGVYGMDTRSVYFVVETADEQERLSQQYPGRILLCDRLFILDTHDKKAITHNGEAITTKLHEVKSVAGESPVTEPRVWPLKVANLPCDCKHCDIDPSNTSCKFAPWRKRRLLHIADNVQLPSAPSISSSASESSDDDSESSDDDEEEMMTIAQLK